MIFFLLSKPVRFVELIEAHHEEDEVEVTVPGSFHCRLDLQGLWAGGLVPCCFCHTFFFFLPRKIMSQVFEKSTTTNLPTSFTLAAKFDHLHDLGTPIDV